MSVRMSIRPLRVEFCGGIGAGKSTVAEMLATRYRLPLVREHYERIPFWEDFYRDPVAFELEKNISFLLFHGNAIRTGMARHDAQSIICDFALFQDLAYAAMSRLPGDYVVIASVHERLIARLDLPDLVIYVRCSLDEQLTRIKRRDREPERAITRDYLEKLSMNIEAQLSGVPSSVAIMEVDTERLDFVRETQSALSAVAPQFERWLNHASRSAQTL
ncbi:MAG: hypothetical protein QOI38_573 [Sphingomonadales bacterium]|nr:hypothetical protein [Sphingomonadales bacterium]